MNFQEFVAALLAEDYADKSSLWAELADGLRAQISEASESLGPEALLDAVDRIDSTMHYGFYMARDEAGLRTRISEARAVVKDAGRIMKQQKPTDGPDLETIGSYVFLNAIGLLEGYFSLLETFGVEPDMASARHFYYAYRVRQAMDEVGLEKARVLEIGAGAGNMSMMLHHHGRVADYTVVDLPEMLVMSGANLGVRAGRDCRFMEFPREHCEPGRYHLLSAAQDLSGLPDGVFDLVLNFNSFSEMKPEVVDAYLDTIYRVAHPGALFINVNRIQGHPQDDGSVFEMNPLLFRYRATDEILELNVDPFQQYVRQFFRAKPVKSTAILRIARV